MPTGSAASCSGLGGREHQRDQQDRPELPMAPAASSWVPNFVFSSPVSRRIGISVPIAVVASADPCRGRDRSRGGEQAADPVGEQERESQPQAPSFSGRPRPLEVDLVAGEEEQHAEPEVGEEVDEVVALGEPEHLGADHDPEQQFDHDDRWRRRLGITTTVTAASAATTMTAKKEPESTSIMRGSFSPYVRRLGLSPSELFLELVDDLDRGRVDLVAGGELERDEVAEHHRPEQALDPGLALALDLDHGGGGGRDQLRGQLGALAQARCWPLSVRKTAENSPGVAARLQPTISS